MAEISLTSAQIRDGVKEILKHADLTTMSAKKVRRTLEDKYDVDLFDRKKEIDQIVMSTITATTTSESEKESPSKKSNDEELPTKDEDTSLDDKEVDSDSSSLGEVEDEPPKKKIKKQKVKTKPERSKPAKTEKKKCAEIVSDCDSDVESTQNDEEMARKLQEEEENGGRVTRNRNAKRTEPPKPTPKRKPKTERKGKSGYSAEMVLSHELAEIVGTNRMARHDVVKRMWEIIRERKLMDPKNKQFMLCDEQLLKVFGKKRVRTFGMMKYLKTHIKDPIYLTS